ncbi:hypothetical protein EO92_16795 [Methanosarcina sp. 2.H.A.1B.4]|jgi:hypothetical protein|nr:hypothetical protein EO92_16795 [Methanosarcina sp. 2.H.A.1B.4]
MSSYSEMQQKKQEEFLKRRAEFERTGIQPPAKPKETWDEWIQFADVDLVDYIGTTKRGALKVELTKGGLKQKTVNFALF